MTRALAAALAAGALSTAAAGEEEAPVVSPIVEITLGSASDTVHVEVGRRRVCLERRPIYVNTLSLSRVVSGRPAEPLVLGVGFAVDENTGCIELFATPADTLVLIASYRYLPVTSELRHHLRTESSSRAPSATTPLPQAPATEPTDDTRLSVGGSKTFVVEVGSNRDATLRQTLDLTLAGRLARDVELEAVLSDRDSPVTPEGTSAELEELDRVLIRITAPQTRATFGDIEVRETRGELARYDRRLEGVRVERTGERLSLGALAANARGLFRSVELFGVEGVQGPYRIADAAGAPVSGIVPGSESVYVDGVPLARGQDRDYIVDYALGELTFTPRRPITFDSRITVDFEEETEDYRRRFAVAESGFEYEDRLSVRALVIRESDDRGVPRGFTLGDEERALLHDLGDEPPEGESVAVRFVGAGNGDYTKVAADSTAPEHFMWVGPGTGDHFVSFVQVGRGFGAYADSVVASGETIFRFVGAGGGDFDPGRRIASPERHALGNVLLGYAGDRVRFDGELAASARDRNTFSPFDDTDNDGLAARGELQVDGPRWARGRGGITIDGSWRSLGRDFSTFSRITRPFDFLDWNYEAGTLTEGEDRRRLALSIEPGGGGTLSLEAGRLQSASVYRANRASLGYRRSGRLALGARVDRTWTERAGLGERGMREVATAEAGYPLWIFAPRIHARSEMGRTSADTTFAGRRFRTAGAELRVLPRLPVSLALDYSRRTDDRRVLRTGREWTRASTTRDRGARVELARWRGVSGRLEIRRRTLESRTAGASRTTNLAALRLEADPAGVSRVLLDYQLTTEAIFPREKIVTFVGEGRGNYDSLGVFVGTGAYDVEIARAEETELVSRVDVALRASFTGRSDPAAPALLRSVRAQSFVRVRQSTRLPFAELVNPFSGALYSPGRESVEGNVTIREEATFFPSSAFSPRVSFEHVERVDGRFENLREQREEDTLTLRLRAAPAPGWTGELEGSTARAADVVERIAPDPAREEQVLTTRRGAAIVTRKPSFDWTISVETALASTRSPETEGRETRVEIEPSVSFSPGRRGRVEGRFRWVEVRDGFARRRPFFVFGLSNVSGTEWSVLADYRVREYLTLAGTLRAARPRGGEPRFDGRMELRAFF